MEVLIWCTALHSSLSSSPSCTKMHQTPYHLYTCTHQNQATAWQRPKSSSKTFQRILVRKGCVEPHPNIFAVYRDLRPRATSTGCLHHKATRRNQENTCLAVDGADGRQAIQLSHNLSSHCSRWLCEVEFEEGTGKIT